VRKVAIAMVALMATSSAFARKTSHHHFKRAAIDHQWATKPNPGGVERHPADVALDRKIGSICCGCYATAARCVPTSGFIRTMSGEAAHAAFNSLVNLQMRVPR
jgi:hypothetical protein